MLKHIVLVRTSNVLPNASSSLSHDNKLRTQLHCQVLPMTIFCSVYTRNIWPIMINIHMGNQNADHLIGEWVESWSAAMDLDQGWNFPFILTSQGNYFIQIYLQLPTIYSIEYFMCVWHSHILSRFMAAQPYNGHTEQLWVTNRGDPIIGID